VDAASPGDVIIVTNGVYATGTRGDGGITNRVVVDRPITVRSVNGPEVTVIEGYQGTTNGTAGVGCVYLTDASVLSGFTLRKGAFGASCASANALLTNCVITVNLRGVSGGTLLNCLIISNSAPDALGGKGGGASNAGLTNCLIVGNSAIYGGGAFLCTLDTCWVSNNVAKRYGGGTAGCWINKCQLIGNTANDYGGGAFGGNMCNSVVSGNFAGSGGGVCGDYFEDVLPPFLSDLNNCTVVGNSAIFFGGGVLACALTDCIIYENTAGTEPNYSGDLGNGIVCTLDACCTTPQPAFGPNGFAQGYGSGNITNPPLFVDPLNGDFRLQSNSPCINSGVDAYAAGPSDFDGRPRVSGGTIDMGAYEFQDPPSRVSYAWLQYYGFPTDGSADYSDPDADGMNNLGEWICGTDPTNSLSVLRLLTPSNTATGIRIGWLSVTNRYYVLERSTNLAATPVFHPLATNLPGQLVTTSFEDTGVLLPVPRLYRISTRR
jgi:hypothetical protein